MRRQGLPATPLSRALSYPALAWERLRRTVKDERQDLLYERYTRLHPLHYGPHGRGYSSVAPASAEERTRRYREQISRLEYFVDAYPDLLQFRDGDSYLDLGCGTGQNIRLLAERFPSSRIVGCDLNADAVEMIRECERHPGLSVGVGDLTDDRFRAEALNSGFDHIVLSHVFSLIFAESREATLELRARIISDLVSACRVSIVVVDAFGAAGLPTITMEQRQRATVSDDVLGYFANHQDGRAYMVQSDRSRAVVFVKNDTGQGGAK